MRVATKKPSSGLELMEFGTSGLQRWGGIVHEEFLEELVGVRGAKVYREMRDNSAILGACLSAIEMLVRQVPWRVKPFGQDNHDLMVAEHVDTCRQDLNVPFTEVVADHFSMLTYGFAPCELVYKIRGGDVNDPTRKSKYSDGRIGWRKIPLRAQETVLQWDFDDAGGVRGLQQLAPPDYRLRQIPIEKLLLFRTRAEKGNPEGRSALRSAYWAWYYAKHAMVTEGIAMERGLNGIPVMYIPAENMLASASDAQKAVYESAKQIVQGIHLDEHHGVVLPQSYTKEGGHPLFKLELLSTSSRAQIDTSAIIERYERRMAMTLLADVIMMGHEAVGSYALSDSKTDLLAVAIGGYLDIVGSVYNTHAIPRLVALNGWPRDRCPQLEHGDIEAPNLAALADYILKMRQSGMPLYAQDWEHLRAAAGLPKAAKDAKPEPNPAAPAPAAEGGDKA